MYFNKIVKNLMCGWLLFSSTAVVSTEKLYLSATFQKTHRMSVALMPVGRAIMPAYPNLGLGISYSTGKWKAISLPP